MARKEKRELRELMEVWMEKAIKVALVLLTVLCIGAGIHSGMWHCWMLAAMSAVLLWVMKLENCK